MHFQTPQFIEIEDKIIGPFTLRQFLYLGGAAFFIFISYYLFETWLWFILGVIAAFIAIVFAFARPNNQPMERILISAIKFFWNPKRYLWRREEKTKKINLESDIKVVKEAKPKIFKKEFKKIAEEDIKKIASRLDK